MEASIAPVKPPASRRSAWRRDSPPASSCASASKSNRLLINVSYRAADWPGHTFLTSSASVDARSGLTPL
jgi:hypothetical protein